MVSQNYVDFRMEKPAPEKTWKQVADVCPAQPAWCCLFESDCPEGRGAGADWRK